MSGVRVGDLITLSGQVSIKDEEERVGGGDVGLQLRSAYQNVKEVLALFGASPDDIVDETWFVTDMDDVMEDVDRLVGVRDQVLGNSSRDVGHTLVQVSKLLEPGLLIEVKCLARVV